MTARIYARVSTLLQSETGFSMAGQESKARAWCAYQGLSEVVLYPEAGVSGLRDDRPQLEAMLSDLTAGDTVVVYALSRLGRGGAVQMLSIVGRIRERGARLVSLTEQIDTESSTGRLMLTILAALAELEVELTRERTEFGRLQAASQGIFPHSPDSLPAGWTTREGRIVEDRFAETVRLIFAQGQASYNSTAELLNSLGLPTTRGKEWRGPAVRRIVLFEGYHTGILRYRSFVLPDQPESWIDIPGPALVTSDVWHAAQRTASVNHRHSKPDLFPLTSHLYCTCGARLYGRNRQGSYPVYFCMERSRGSAVCASNGMVSRIWGPSETLNQQAREALARYLTDSSDPARLLAHAVPVVDPHAAERAELDRRLSALVDLHLDGMIDRSDYEVRRALLVSQRRALEFVPEPVAEDEVKWPQLAAQVLASTNLELASLLEDFQAQFAMNPDATLRVLSVVPLE